MSSSQVSVLLISLVTWQAVFGTCFKGYFGPDCKLACHCRRSKTCEEFEGVCPKNEPCSLAFFGPSCQYVDLAHSNMASGTPAYLEDSDDTTCNPDSTESVLNVEFTDHLRPFHWLRLVLNINANSASFSFRYARGNTLLREKSFIVNNRTIDITGQARENLTDISLNGTVVGHLCSIYISGGRNFASLGYAMQSSNQVGNLARCGAQNAIDLDLSSNYDNNSCSSTQVEYGKAVPTWNLTMDVPSIILYMNLYNRDVYSYRLKGALVNVYDSSNKLFYTTRIETIAGVYRFIVRSDKFVSKIQISVSLSPTNFGNDRTLTICEMEVFVEYFCPQGKWGLFCIWDCTCSKIQICSSVTGACAHGCPNGFYGPKCTDVCSDNCLDKICEDVSGKCVMCAAGKKGLNCDEDCLPGTFGLDCFSNCSDGCSATCDKVAGNCTCKFRYSGTSCTEKFCPENTHGPNCSDTCTCDKSQKCNAITGACTQICPIGFYGPTCKTACSNKCIDKSCEPVSGYCIKCDLGKKGISCGEDCDPGTFGSACNYHCSVGCLGICDAFTGQCNCKPRFIGRTCSDCKYNAYGSTCNSSCSATCLDSACDPKTGKCLACRENFIGDFCEGCVAHMYGKMCTQMCQITCMNRTCNAVSGACNLCISGFTGDFCTDTSLVSSYFYWLLLLPLLLLYCGFYFMRRSKRAQSPPVAPMSKRKEDIPNERSAAGNGNTLTDDQKPWFTSINIW